jgi:hypothetical protein
LKAELIFQRKVGVVVMMSIFIALKVLCNVVAGELRLCGVLALSAATRTSVASQRSMRYVWLKV